MKLQSSFNFLILLIICSCVKPATKDYEQTIVGELGNEVMVVTAHPEATQVGVDILEKGGNAYDAAVAVQFSLAVVYPRAGNIGGGGFMVSRTHNGDVLALDFREKAPKAATTDMYLDDNGDPIDNLSTEGYLAVGVPGSVAGMIEIHNSYGALPWSEVVQPAIDLATLGFVLTENEANIYNRYHDTFEKVNGEIIFNSRSFSVGDTLKLPALAQTLTNIKENGFDGFYKGETADIIAREMKKHGGLITKEDLQDYEAVWRHPIVGDYNSYKIISMPPPSSGGIALMQLLKGVEQNHNHLGAHNSVKTAHLYTELERRVYADRATYLGDTDFYNVPIDMLISDDYNQKQNSTIDWNTATPSTEIKGGGFSVIESIETTHFSIVDHQGNAVAITTTINGNFGSKVFLSDLGFFLNNEMDDFSMKPGVHNMFGLIGSEANKIEPEKRMLSSMTPTIVEKDGELFMVVGTPGGSTIITSVFQTILNVIEFDMTMQEAVNAKKLHHQWVPDHILVESGALSEENQKKFEAMGHKVIPVNSIGRVDAILVHENGQLEGAADPRGDDNAKGY